MKDIVEIRWHGRGGQGAKTASLLLADAAFNTGKYVQGFPEYGPERMGAPITAYNRISDQRSTVHSNIYFPDYVVVVDETLLSAVDVTAGLKKEGAIVINSSKSPAELRPLLKGYEGRVCTIDAGKISEEDVYKRQLQVPGKPRDTMIGAMREVAAVANAEGVPLSEKDVAAWMDIIDHLPSNGETSMRQDGKNHRKSEVELFAGTIRRLAAKHGISVPVNDWLYQQIQEMERNY